MIRVDAIVEAEPVVVATFASSIKREAFHEDGFDETPMCVFRRFRALVRHLGESAELGRTLILNAQGFSLVFANGRI